MSDPLDVTGSWEGIFNYPRTMPASGFRCELREHGGVVTGETQERGDAGAERGQTLLALLDGRRDGHALRFVKRYDDPARARYAVTTPLRAFHGTAGHIRLSSSSSPSSIPVHCMASLKANLLSW